MVLLFCLDSRRTMLSDHFSHSEALLKSTQIICNHMLLTIAFRNNCIYFTIPTVISTKEIALVLEELDHSESTL